MTYVEFEQKFCKWAQDDGWWALNIPRSRAGQQPFDVIAVKGACVLAVDCKVTGGKHLRFPLDRVEDNQWLAFSSIMSKSNNVLCGIAVWMNQYSQMFFIPYHELCIAKEHGKASIELGANHRLERIDFLRGIHS